jgi:hypothetical protein
VIRPGELRLATVVRARFANAGAGNEIAVGEGGGGEPGFGQCR